jgi:hypothetical protein
VIRIERKKYKGWNNAYALTNGVVELIVLGDVGPRIVNYGVRGGDNQLYVFAGQAGQVGGAEFRLYGGHRLWVWPEVQSTYYPDNVAVEVTELSDGLCFVAPIEAMSPGIGLRKKMEVRIPDGDTHVIVSHTVSNCGGQTVRVAPWTPTVMRPGGRAILPFPSRAAMDKDHFQSVGPLTLWSFTDFSDPRWKLGRDFLQLEQRQTTAGQFAEQMTGLFNPAEWGAYYRSGTLFVKRASLVAGATYPDYGCNFEVFTNPEFLELETMGPVVDLVPGQSTTHDEHWWLFENVPSGEDDPWIHAAIVPRVQRTVNR